MTMLLPHLFAHSTNGGIVDPVLSNGPSDVPQTVICEGWVLKKRRKMMQGFARRYFILQQSGLLSYSFEPGKPSRDEIFLPRAAISTTPGHKDIHIDSDAATFHIKCLTTDDFNKWMTAFRRFIVTNTQRASTVRSPRLASWSFNKFGAILDEMGSTISELEDSILATQNEIPPKRDHVPKSKDRHKEHLNANLFAFFKRSGHTSINESNADDSHGDGSSSSSQTHSQERVHVALNSLKAQHASLLKYIQILLLPESNQPSAQTAFLPPTAEEEGFATPVLKISPTRPSKQASIATSFSDTLSEWFDAQDGMDGAQEFVLDTRPSPVELDQKNEVDTPEHHSISEPHESGTDTDAEDDEDPSLKSTIKAKPRHPLVEASQVVRRTRLAAGPAGDEGSLFAILKKNVGKDLSTISFPVTFNEPLTLLQRTAEEVEYHDLLRQAATTTDPLERLSYIAAFAVSGYAHTRFRTGRKGFNPMLGETFEDARMKFIAEKVRHQPLVIAYHAEGEGWELYATSAGRTKFWGKSLEVIPLGTTHLKIGNDHYEWKKPSSFVRNLMMGTKYLEHCGKLTIENTTTKALCVLDFKQGGLWGASNVVSGTISSPSGEVVSELEGKWDDHFSQTVDYSNFRILWRMNAFPKNAQEFYGFTSFGITLNEITNDLEGVLPPTDSRYRPDVRALEEGNLDEAELEKLRVEEMQRDRRKRQLEREPRWFKQVGDDWIYTGGYWEGRERGWEGVRIDNLW